MPFRDDQVVLPRNAPAETGHADDKQRNLCSVSSDGAENIGVTNGKSDVDDVFSDNCFFGAPYIFEEVLHDQDGLVPYQFVVPLQRCARLGLRCRFTMQPKTMQQKQRATDF